LIYFRFFFSRYFFIFLLFFLLSLFIFIFFIFIFQNRWLQEPIVMFGWLQIQLQLKDQSLLVTFNLSKQIWCVWFPLCFQFHWSINCWNMDLMKWLFVSGLNFDFLSLRIYYSLFYQYFSFFFFIFLFYFRNRLTQYLYSRYLNGYTYYRLGNLDNRISNPDQLLTADVDKFCTSVTDLYSNLSKPILDIIIYANKLTGTIGIQGPTTMVNEWNELKMREREREREKKRNRKLENKVMKINVWYFLLFLAFLFGIEWIFLDNVASSNFKIHRCRTTIRRSFQICKQSFDYKCRRNRFLQWKQKGRSSS